MQEESVYNLIPRPAEEFIKPPMYRSKHDAQVPPSCSLMGLQGTSKLTANNSGKEVRPSANRKDAATFGKEVAPEVVPEEFLKKSQRDLPKAGTFHRNTLSGYRAPVPKRTEKPVMGLTTDKDFLVANAVETILAVPKRTKMEEPPATQLKTFGKVPKYLTRIKNDISEERTYLQRLNNQKSAGEREQLRPMGEEEKAELIAGLKRKWHDIHKQYQTLTFNIDTVTKVQRKEGLEAEMEQIEKAIEKLSKRNIHVYDDSEFW